MKKRNPAMNRKNSDGEVRRALAVFTQLGLRMAICVFLGVFGAKFLVVRFGAPLWVTLIGGLLGMGAAFKAMYDMVKQWLD